MALDNILAEFSEKSLQEKQEQLFDWISDPEKLEINVQDIDALLACTADDPTLELLARAVITAKYPCLQTLQNLILQGIKGGEELQALLSFLLFNEIERSGKKVSVKLYVDSYLNNRRDTFGSMFKDHKALQNFKLFHANDYIFLAKHPEARSLTKLFFRELMSTFSELNPQGILEHAVSNFTNFLGENEKLEWIESLLSLQWHKKAVIAHYVTVIAKHLSDAREISKVAESLKRMLQQVEQEYSKHLEKGNNQNAPPLNYDRDKLKLETTIASIKETLTAFQRETETIKTTPQILDSAILPTSTQDDYRSDTLKEAKAALSSSDQEMRSRLVRQYWESFNNAPPIMKDLEKQYFLQYQEIERVLNYRIQRRSDQREYHSLLSRYSVFGGMRKLIGASSRTQKLAAVDWLLNRLNNPESEALDPALQKALKTGELGKAYKSCQRAGLC